jgi:hypothetical protein
MSENLKCLCACALSHCFVGPVCRSRLGSCTPSTIPHPVRFSLTRQLPRLSARHGLHRRLLTGRRRWSQCAALSEDVSATARPESQARGREVQLRAGRPGEVGEDHRGVRGGRRRREVPRGAAAEQAAGAQRHPGDQAPRT